jgi:hypothetical protein
MHSRAGVIDGAFTTPAQFAAMQRRVGVAFGALTLVGVALTGCGIYRYEQREAWRTQAEESCLAQKLVTPTAYMSASAPIDGPGACGISHPFKIAAFGGGEISLRQPVTLGCPIIPRIDGWFDEVVQPAAELYFGTRVAEVRSGSYSCRGRNNQAGARLSEHSYGNAMDVMSFRLVDGREINIERGWRGAQDEQEFLREVFVGACRYFTTVLGPGSDAFHYNHFHIDLARHDARGERRVCKPLIKFEPRLDASGQRDQTRLPPPPQRSFTPPQRAPEGEEPDEIDEDNDPFAVSSHAPARRGSPASAPAATALREVEPAYASRLSGRGLAAAPLPPSASVGAAAPYRSAPQTSFASEGPTPPQRPLVLQPQLWAARPSY